MQGGKLIISRGMQHAAEMPPRRDAGPQPRPELRAVPSSPAPQRPAPAPTAAQASVADFVLVRERIDALERLSLLRDIGVLDAEEFAAEKALVLRLPAEELLLDSDDILPVRGPSLLGRLLSWKLVGLGAIAGLAFSYYTAPQDLTNLADRLSRLIG